MNFTGLVLYNLSDCVGFPDSEFPPKAPPEADQPLAGGPPSAEDKRGQGKIAGLAMAAIVSGFRVS